MHRATTLPILLLSLFAFGCQTTGSEVGDEQPETSGDGDGDPTGDGDPSGDGDTNDSGGPTFNCDPSEDMPCPEGQKCTVLTSTGTPIYDCVPDDGALLPFDPCNPDPNTGQDQCPAGHTCIPSTPDSPSGLCLQLCGNDDDCEVALCGTPPGLQIPVCAAICDPLAPLCPDLQVCQRVRQSNFVCQYPRMGDNGSTADPCNSVNDSGCAEGFVCETGGIIPGCTEPNCCTALCDLSDANPCQTPMICGDIPLDPQPGLENVGACYVPQ